MRMKVKIAVTVLGLHWVSATHAAVPVFGIPLGGVPSKPVKVCNSDIDKRPDLCWIVKPKLDKSGSSSAGVSIPEKDLPDWAAYRTFSMVVDRQGAVDSLSADLREKCDVHQIASSISARFGKPVDDRLNNLLMVAEWVTPDIRIHLLSTGKTCTLSVSTTKYAQEQKLLREKQEIKRPSMP
jgi:hypothetical protein